MMISKVYVYVTSIRSIDSIFVISGITKNGKMLINSKKKFNPGELLEATGDIKDVEDIREMDAGEIRWVSSKSTVKKEMGEIEDYIDSKIKVTKSIPTISDQVIGRLSKGFDEVARRIMKAVFMHRPVIIRHHYDTDGVCCGLAMYLAVGMAKNVRILTNKYPAYRLVEAQQDLDMMRQMDVSYLPPLLVVFDLGSGIDSFDSYDYVKKAGWEILVVDHHPPYPGLDKHVDYIVSPHLAGGDSSYCAGLLASEVSQRIVKLDLRDLPYIAMVGDRSSLKFKREERYLKYAIALDYLVTMKDPTIDEMAKNFLDRESLEMSYMQAMERIDVVKQNLLRKMKTKCFKNVTVFMINTDKEFDEAYFPSRGTMANIISDEMSMPLKTPGITLSCGKKNINTRFNKPAIEAGWSGVVLINKIREELPNALESGGGHHAAASMRINKGFAKIVLEQLLKEIEKEAEKKK